MWKIVLPLCAVILASCGAPTDKGCTPAQAAKHVEKLAKDLAAAQDAGKIDAATMRRVSERMAEAGRFYSSTNDANKYCADMGEVRALAGLPAPRGGQP